MRSRKKGNISGEKMFVVRFVARKTEYRREKVWVMRVSDQSIA